MRFLLLLLLLLIFAGSASSHPLTDGRYDRTIAVRLSAEGIEVTYTLEVNLLAMHLDAYKRLTPEEIARLDGTAKGYAKAYANKVALEVIDKFRLQLDGEPLPLRVVTSNVDVVDHAVCRFTLRGAWPPGGGERKLTVTDGTFPNQPGILNLTLDVKGTSGKQVEIIDLEEPSPKVRTRSLLLLTPEEAASARRAIAVIRLASPPTNGPSTSPNSQLGAESKVSEPIPEPVVNDRIPPPANLLADLAQRGLPALFDSTLGIGFLLMAAFLFGAAHAFTPGHGKTLVAAYLIGERGTVRHAILLATVTTVTHTGSVIAVAAVLWGVYGNSVPNKMQGNLQFVAGLLVLGVGLWLLLRRATGQADHFHLFGNHHHHHHDDELSPADHSHSHDHAHSHSHGDGHHHHGAPPESAKTTGGWLRIVLMGMGGGLVPCWDAVLLLIAATAMNRVAFAIPLLLSFSLGLGVVLVGLGIGVVYAYKMGAHRFQERRWFQLLPIASAVLLIGVGFWLCKQAVNMTAPQ